MTNGSELITGLTNLVIMFTTLVVFFKIYKFLKESFAVIF